MENRGQSRIFALALVRYEVLAFLNQLDWLEQVRGTCI